MLLTTEQFPSYQFQEKSSATDNQFGFREERETIDAIFIVWQVIEKAKEHSVNLHSNFIDFKSALDTIWRKALWKMLRGIGLSKDSQYYGRAVQEHEMRGFN